METTGSVGITCPGAIPAEMEAHGPDDRLGADVDQVLVVEGALGEQQAGPGAHPSEAAPPRVIGADRPQLGGTLPRRVHQPGQRPPQRCREGAGPAHAGMVGGAADPLVTGPAKVRMQGAVVNFVSCSPSQRTVAPTPCRRRPQTPHRPPPVPAALRARRGRIRRRTRLGQSTRSNVCRPEPGAAPPTAARRGRPALPSGVIVPTAPWLIAENAKPGTLNWICNHVQPDHALEGFASQVSAVPGDDVALFVNTTAQRRPGAGLPDGLLPGARWPPRRADGLRPGQGPGRAGGHARHRHGDLPVVAHPHAQHHEGLAARLLPLEARRRRRRGAVRPAHDPRRHVHGVVRVAEQRHHLAGLQPVGQLQPLLRARRQGSSHLRQPRPSRLLRPPLPADLGLGRGRLRRQRAAAAVPPREPRAGPDLLDRRRPACPARSCS